MIIYIARNKINGKCYVGKTTYSFESRKKAHIRESLVEAPKTHFHKAIKKWGLDAFEWQIVETTDNEQALNELEQLYIRRQNSFIAGYNQTLGGEGQKGWVPSEETRILWSSQRKGKNQYILHPRIKSQKPTISEEEKQRRKEEKSRKVSEKLRGREPWNKGKKDWQTIAGIDKTQSHAKTQQKRRESGYIWMIEATILETNEVITFNSQAEAKKYFGFDYKAIRNKIDKEPHKGVFFRRLDPILSVVQ